MSKIYGYDCIVEGSSARKVIVHREPVVTYEHSENTVDLYEYISFVKSDLKKESRIEELRGAPLEESIEQSIGMKLILAALFAVPTILICILMAIV